MIGRESTTPAHTIRHFQRNGMVRAGRPLSDEDETPTRCRLLE